MRGTEAQKARCSTAWQGRCSKLTRREPSLLKNKAEGTKQLAEASSACNLDGHAPPGAGHGRVEVDRLDGHHVKHEAQRLGDNRRHVGEERACMYTPADGCLAVGGAQTRVKPLTRHPTQPPANSPHPGKQQRTQKAGGVERKLDARSQGKRLRICVLEVQRGSR